MANFTPGPWQLIGDHLYAPGGVLVATTEGHGAETADCEACANGRLMAASPDLLEALRAALAWHECETHSDHCWSLVHAAIAKARGESEADRG